MYRCHPQTAKLVELLRDGVIGQVRMIRASFGFGGGDSINPKARLFAAELGGGGILDVGCYPVSFARLVAGAVDGKRFADPVHVKAAGRVGQTEVDEWAAAVLGFDNGIIAQVATAIRASLDNNAVIVGADGTIILPDPWQASRDAPTAGQIIVRKGNDEKRIDIPTKMNAFSCEAALVARAVAAGQVEGEAPAMSWADTLGNLATLDRWRSEVGVEYPDERPVASVNTVANRPLRRRDDHPMKYDRIKHLDKPISRFIFGCDNQGTYAHGSIVWDDWFERGGNAFDTSWVYGGGRQEKLLGQWIAARSVRDDVVVTIKGAHTPRCTPGLMVSDFHQSLDRLQFDHADIYVMHRDNLDVPVDEFVDVLNELIDKGLIRGAIGGSNWTLKRFDAFNRAAQAAGRQPMTVLNNNLSLVEMIEPVWPGCLHVSDNDSRKYLADNKIANMSWSSQARGYFLDEDQRLKLGAGNFAKWDSPGNQQRRERAEKLAADKGVTPINIAAAWVLCQPFPSFALIGPRNVEETATTMPALGIQLTQDEIDWLWNG
jgi:aryl-alcohol dehydrogenase-like predicted oxidoreductase